MICDLINLLLVLVAGSCIAAGLALSALVPGGAS